MKAPAKSFRSAIPKKVFLEPDQFGPCHKSKARSKLTWPKKQLFCGWLTYRTILAVAHVRLNFGDFKVPQKRTVSNYRSMMWSYLNIIML